MAGNDKAPSQLTKNLREEPTVKSHGALAESNEATSGELNTLEQPTVTKPIDTTTAAQSTNKSRRLAKRTEKAAAATEETASEAEAEAASSRHKQRRELDVMNRLRWDDRFSTANIIIGYEDRHSERGIVEIAFQDWEKESTAEEFVPLHRIRYFRRADADGEVLWHRALRIDKVFGPG